MKELTVSIFYNQEEWHILNTAFIIPLLDSLDKGNDNLQFNILLNSLNGSNVKLILLLPDDDFEDCKHLIDSKLRFFLSHNPSAPVSLSFPLKGFFMDFPNNTYWYNIYYQGSALWFNTMNDNNFKKIHACLSRTILNTLSNERIDNESIFTFSLYLQIGIVRAGSNNLKEAKKLVSGMLSCFDQKEEKRMIDSELAEDQLKNLYSRNESILAEIFKDVWNRPCSADLAWLENWINTCSVTIKENISGCKTSYNLLKAINDHLETSLSTSLVTLKLVNMALQKM